LSATRDRFPWSALVAAPRALHDLGNLLVNQPGSRPRYSIAP
jgi:hypothetical protein